MAKGLLTVSLLLLLAAACSARIHHAVLERDNRYQVPLTEAFAFRRDGLGRIVVKLKDITVYVPHEGDKPNFANFGFVLSSMDEEYMMTQGSAGFVDDTGTAGILPPTDESNIQQDTCLLRSPDHKNVLFDFKDSGVQNILEHSDQEFVWPGKVDDTEEGRYTVYFINCEYGKNLAISFDATIELFNLNANGDKDYLSVGETPLEAVYWVMFALFASIGGAWAWYVWKNKAHSHRIHYLMGLLCLLKALTVMCQAGEYHYIERTGHADGWNVAYYIFTFLRGVLFFTVVVLIGTGWSYMKPFLGDKEKRILMVVIPLQVFANIAIIVTEEENPSVTDFFTWRDVFHLVDIICCCAILFPIVWSIKQLREAAHTDGKLARVVEKLTLFRQFYVMVVVYIYFTRIVVYLLRSTVQAEYLWISDTADQLAALAFYVWTAVKFRPQPNNPYLKLETSEIEL